MKSLLLAFFVMGLGYSVSGCQLGCTELACTEGVEITLKGVATKYAGSLPLTIKPCAEDGSCLVVKVSETGGAFACEATGDTSFPECSITPAGDVSFTLGFKAEAKSDVAAIKVAVLDSAGATVFDGTKSAELHDVEANGPGCGVTCHQGEALFTP